MISRQRGDPTVHDIKEILSTIPHRYPFLLIDRIIEIDPGKRVRALKNVTANEPYFAGHFPGNPIMPGVMILEALAQAGAYVALYGKSPGYIALFAGIDNARFRQPVYPGDQLILDVELVKFKGPFGRARCVARVDANVAAECDIIFAVTDEGAAEDS